MSFWGKSRWNWALKCPWVTGLVWAITATAAAQDCDSNGVVDGCDYRVFAECLAGPGVNTGAGCACGDADGDGAVDLADFAEFQAEFTGLSPDCDGNGVPDACDADCNSNGVADGCDLAAGTSVDFNANGVPDECDPDCQPNGYPDFLDIIFGVSRDCDRNQVPDECDLREGSDQDCNNNGWLDRCDIAAGTSLDCNNNGIADECEPDCNSNGIPDDCDLAAGTSPDCQTNGLPDECEPGYADCNFNGTADECELAENDCNSNGVLDDCEHLDDCNTNGFPDACDIAAGISADCQSNGVPDECEIPPPEIRTYFLTPALAIPDNQPAGISATIAVADAGAISRVEVGLFITHTWQGDLRATLSHGGVTVALLNRPGSSLAGCGTSPLGYSADNFGSALSPLVLHDEAVPPIDCYAGPGVPGVGGYAGPARPSSALAEFAGLDQGGDWTLTVSDHAASQTGTLRLWALVIHAAPAGDCNDDGVPDECEPDCNANGVPDNCEIAFGTAADCNTNGVPDECEFDIVGAGDCNSNGTADACDLAAGVSTDCNGNGRPDECDLAAGTSPDSNSNGVPDECDVRVVYVREGANGLNDGSSWADAHTDLQSALLEGVGEAYTTEIWVSAGTYRPAGANGDRAATFLLRNRLRLYGGFFGNEAEASERDPASNPTVLSGDLNGDDGSNFANNGENSFHVVTASGTDASAVLDGLTISGGNADGACCTQDRGGGLFTESGRPTITFCDFVANKARVAGGAIYCSGGGPTITDTTLIGNAANLGGAMYVVTGSTPGLAGCTFQGNTASQAGGALFIASSSRGALVGCALIGNSAADRGGGVYAASFASPVLVNCALVGNTAANGGGAVYATGSSAPALTNCSVSGNWSSGSGSGLAAFQNSTLHVSNSILWANPPMPVGAGAGQADQLLLSGGSAVVRYSCIQGWSSESGGVGNIGLDPLFTRNPSDGGDGWGVGDNDDYGDLRLLAGSPCIDAGDNGVDIDPATPGVQSLPELDLDGLPRQVDDPLTADTGVGTPPLVDLGCYERPEQGY